MASAKSKSKRRGASRRASERPERQQDPRLVASLALKRNGEEMPPGTWILGVSPVLMDDGELLLWHPPQPVAFNLVEAKRHSDRGVKARRNIMAKLTRREKGEGISPTNSAATIDCVRDLQSGVLFAFTALESLANHAIEMLDDGFTLSRKGKTIRKTALIRALGIDEKFKRVVPQVEGGTKVAGTAAWERYLQLKDLRDELLHVKRRGMEPDKHRRTAYDRLLLGEADNCAQDALAVIDGVWPGFLPDHVREELT